MIKFYIKRMFVFFAFCGFFNSMSGQNYSFEISLWQQVDSSSQIVEGKVISKRSLWDLNRGNIYTINTVEVYKVFKGENHAHIEIITEGGLVGSTAQITCPSLELSIGDIGVFMLNDSRVLLDSNTNHNVKQYEAYSSFQGFYKYNIPDDTASNPYNIIENINDNFYSVIVSLTGINYHIISAFDIEEYSSELFAGTISITSFNPETITGGTKSILTINGMGFGNSVGTVLFKDANDGGASYYTALSSQIINWSDTQIQVEVPSRAGTGSVRVISSTNAVVTSSAPIIVPYSEINFIGASNIAYPTQHVNDNGNGGFTWSMNVNFFANAAAKDSFMRAFDTWRCETGVNWELSPTFTGVNEIALDNVNVIRFDVGNELPAGTLGRNTSYFSSCSSGSSLVYYVSELDIVFNDTTNWQYGPANAGGSQIDFETVAVHELGHGHQLAHVINFNAIMHYAIGGGVNNRNLSANDIAGGNDVQNRSTTNPVCGQGLMTNHPCSLGMDEYEIDNYISVYPNPAKDNIFIKNDSSHRIHKVEIYDITGRSIQKSSLLDSSTLHHINLDNYANGLYIMNIQVEDIHITKKFIVE